MARSILIFRGLIASDIDNQYHANYGQLGFALKDLRNPDWAAAEEALTLAIRNRGDAHDGKHLSYEFNRALCRIEQDESFRKENPSNEEIKSLF
jgi:hypothetical protein